MGPILQNTRNRSKIWGNNSKSHKHLVGFGCNSASAILSKTFCPCARTGHLLSHPLIDYSGKSTSIAICVRELVQLMKRQKRQLQEKDSQLFRALGKNFSWNSAMGPFPLLESLSLVFFWLLACPSASCYHVANSMFTLAFQGHSLLYEIITFYKEQIFVRWGKPAGLLREYKNILFWTISNVNMSG